MTSDSRCFSTGAAPRRGSSSGSPRTPNAVWTAHSRSDGTVWLTAEQVCEQLRISRPLWAELAGLLEAGGLLAPHGARYVVPDAQVLEGPGRHYTPGGWRSLHPSQERHLTPVWPPTSRRSLTAGR
jgi:hypothetical protein